VVGNDIIDLYHFESPRYHSLRYLERVSVPAESNAIRYSRDPVSALSAIWAAKEAAFKLLSKEGFTAHFIPRHFVVTLSTEPPLAETAGTVVHCSRIIFVRMLRTHEWVHAIATARSSHVTSSVVEEIQGEASKVPGPVEESRAARRLGEKLLASLEEPGMILAYSGCIPFLKLANGTPANLDISLSHHGRFAAAVIAPREAQLSNPSNSGRHLRACPAMEASCCTCMA
jgi:phosphopantetheinyl transferase (holo-ACP synthase)